MTATLLREPAGPAPFAREDAARPHAPRGRTASPRGPLRLGDKLLQAGLITADELEAALHEGTSKKMRLGEALIELGFLDKDELLPFLQDQLQVPAIQLRDGLVDPQVVQVLPRPKAEAL